MLSLPAPSAALEWPAWCRGFWRWQRRATTCEPPGSLCPHRRAVRPCGGDPLVDVIGIRRELSAMLWTCAIDRLSFITQIPANGVPGDANLARNLTDTDPLAMQYSDLHSPFLLDHLGPVAGLLWGARLNDVEGQFSFGGVGQFCIGGDMLMPCSRQSCGTGVPLSAFLKSPGSGCRCNGTSSCRTSSAQRTRTFYFWLLLLSGGITLRRLPCVKTT